MRKKSVRGLHFLSVGFILNDVSFDVSPSSRGLGHQVLILVTWVRIPLGMPFFCLFEAENAVFPAFFHVCMCGGSVWQIRFFRGKQAGAADASRTGNEAADHPFFSKIAARKRKQKKTHGFSRSRENVLKKVAARPGLEPRLNEPESLVLPLHQRAVTRK